MNAGLLGEHLASPRTAPKTNQSTALDTPTVSNGDPSDQSGFASFVTRDTDATSYDAKQSSSTIETAQATVVEVSPESALPALEAAPQALSEASPTALAGTDIVAQLHSGPASENSDLIAATANPETDIDKAPPAAGDLTTKRVDLPNAEIATADPRQAPPADRTDAAVTPDVETVKLQENVDQVRANSLTRRDAETDHDLTMDHTKATRADSRQADAEVPRPKTPAGPSEQATTALSDTRQTLAAEPSALDRTGFGGVTRDVASATTELVVNFTQVSTPSTPATIPAGLTPTAPSIPLATPNEITGIILNALNNGVDPQEQLVVQLDPPELGRVMIDFKFDAQGLQQIVVTSENPEALKRLRELHFELTQALREHGLSEQNMSFRQQADGQSQDTWSSSEPDRQTNQFTAAEDRRASLTASSTAPRAQTRDRLDLLL